MKLELLTLLECMSSPPVVDWIRVAQSIVLVVDWIRVAQSLVLVVVLSLRLLICTPG